MWLPNALAAQKKPAARIVPSHEGEKAVMVGGVRHGFCIRIHEGNKLVFNDVENSLSIGYRLTYKPTPYRDLDGCILYTEE